MPDISPDRVINTMQAHLRTSAIKAAIELDIFTAIAEGAEAAAAIGERTGAAERGIRVLADYLTAMEFLEKIGDNYKLTPVSAAFLDRRSPAFLGDVHRILAAPEMLNLTLGDPAAFVRNGGSVGLANTAPNHPIWITFGRYMVPIIGRVAQAVAAHFAALNPAPGRVLDIAAGHGLFGIALARQFPATEVTALDWDNVLDVARENAAAAGLGDRFKTLPGSAFDVAFGGPYDMVLIPNFLHNCDEATCISLLVKTRAALAQGGRVAIVEFVPDEDQISQLGLAPFAYLMLATTPGGDCHSSSTLTRMLISAGFRPPDFEPLPPTRATLIVSEPA